MKNKKIYVVIGGISILLMVAYFVITNINSNKNMPSHDGHNNEMSNNSKEESNKKSLKELPIPKILEDTNPDPNIAEFTLESQEGKTVFLENKETETMGYNGGYLGPVIRVKRGEEVKVNVNNKLQEPTTLHWHGLEVDGENDGGPHQGIQPGTTWTPNFTIKQPASTLWYHPHFIGNTATQVYKGLAGLFYIDDEVSESLNIPKEYGVNDIPLVIQDRSFNDDGSFLYETNMMDGAVGDTILVNGAIYPTLKVGTEKIRLRIVNGANASNFDLKLSNKDEFYQIASDGGFLEKPVRKDTMFLSPGERSEIIIDFSRYEVGEEVELISNNNKVIKLVVDKKVEDTTEIPENLTEVNRFSEKNVVVERKFKLEGMGRMVSINGDKFNMDEINEFGNYGDVEIWTITNPSTMMHSMGHPFHIHGTQFQVLSRDGKKPSAEENGFKDTVYIDSDEEVKLLVKFNQKGIYMYHCHILEHEEEGMMGQIEIE